VTSAVPNPAAFLEAFVRIPSPSGEEAAAAAWLVAQMREMGFDTAGIDAAGSPVGVLGEGENVLMLLGHIDTVSGVVPVRRDGDLLYGRGAVDAKGPLAAFTLAAAAVGRRSGWRIVVAGAVEEEAGTARGAQALLTAWQPAACVIGEPSGWERLCIGYKGRLLVDYRLRRPMSHTAGPGAGACEIAVAFWNGVTALARDLNAGRRGAFEQLSPSLRAIRSTSDGLTETVEARLGLRLPPWLTAAEAEARLATLAGDAELAFAGREEAFRTGKSNPLVRAFLTAIRATSGDPGFVVKTGTADMNVVGPAWGCPILAYGPGDSRLDHTPHEHLAISELQRAIDVLRRVITAMTAIV
jgi:LysW-gamma-L-lysine carboxypeptidase